MFALLSPSFLKDLILFPLTRMEEKSLSDLLAYKYDARLLHKDEKIIKVYGNYFINLVLTNRKMTVSRQINSTHNVLNEVFAMPYTQIGTYEVYRMRFIGSKILKIVSAPGLTRYWFFSGDADVIELISIMDDYTIKAQNSSWDSM